MGVLDSVWLLQSRQSVARSFVHSPSASPKVEREEDPTVRASAAPEGAEEQPLRWTDEGRRSSGVTDDVITARMREHKEDSARGRDVRWVVQGGKTSAKSFTKQNPGYKWTITKVMVRTRGACGWLSELSTSSSLARCQNQVLSV